MKPVIQFSKNNIRNPDNPPVAFAFEGVPVPNVEGDVTAPSGNTGDIKIFNAAQAARKVRESFPEAFQQFAEIISSWKDAKAEVQRLKDEIAASPSRKDAYVLEMDGEIESAEDLIAHADSLHAKLDKAEAQAEVNYAYFARCCEASHKALKALNDSLVQEAARRAEKAHSKADEVVDAAARFLAKAKAFDSYGAEELTTEINSTMPTYNQKYTERAVKALEGEVTTLFRLKERYE
jgi:hypothetical protein